MGLRTTDPALYERLLAPPSPLKHDESCPEDQECEDNEALIDSLLSIDEVVSQIANDIPGPLADFSGDEDEGIDGFCCEDPHRPARALEPFNAQFATSHWPRWDGHGTT